MRFLVDVCAGMSVSQWLANRGHDVENTAERDPKLSDSEILNWAFRENRILVTLDKDFQKLAFLVGKPHSGIIRLPNVDRARRLELLAIVLGKHAEDLSKSSIITVKPGKIRVTRKND